MMTKSTFFTALFLLTLFPVFSQIVKGSKTLNESSIGFAISKRTDLVANYDVSDIYIPLKIGVPDFMVLDKLQIGAPVTLNYYTRNQKNSATNSETSTATFSFQANPQATYFFPNKNGSFFVTVGAELSNEYRTLKTTPSTSPSALYSKFLYSLNIGAGCVKPIDESVFWKGKLDFSRSNEKESILALRVGLTNFVRHLSTPKEEDTPQYLTPGKSILDAQLSFVHSDQLFYTDELRISFSQLKFINSHFAFGGYGGYFFRAAEGAIGDNKIHNILGGAKARYYIGISDKWFIYPELKLGASFFTSGGQNGLSLVFDKSVGFNYFITNNAALDVNFSLDFKNNNAKNTSTNFSSHYFSSGINFGLTYFVGKIF